MRAAVVQLLREDPHVAAVVGERVFERQGVYGGISRDATPEAWDTDGDLLPSLVVQMETRTLHPQRLGRDTVAARQVVAVFALAQHGYGAQETALRAVLAALHGRMGLQPVNDTHLRISEIAWSEDTGALIDPALEVPMLASRFTATVTHPLAPTPTGG